MKKITSLVTILIFSLLTHAQNVGIGTTTPQAKLEVKNSVKADVKISSNNFADTSRLILSNRNASNEGSDMNISFNRENALKFHTTSDLAGFVNDSILYLRTDGRIGVGTTAPTEKLDVNGNMNVRGTIKANGTDGSAGQVLMKNNSGNLSWGDASQYGNVIGFPGFGSLSNVSNWTVPANVTKIFIEAWGAGGGGASGGGGAGGGYAAVQLSVAPGNVVDIEVGGYGGGASGNGGAGSDGKNTIVQVNSFMLTVYGGNGASVLNGGNGRSFISSPFDGPYGQSGCSGESTVETYGQYNSTSYYTAITYGSGGHAGNTNFTEKNGGFYSFNNANSSLFKIVNSLNGTYPGGGGGGRFTGGSSGSAGQVLVRY